MNVVQVDDLLTFRQFSKKAADDVFDVCSVLSACEIPLMCILQCSTTRMSAERLAQAKCARTSSRTSAAYRSSLVRVCG